ncbi:MAG: hypothetical protein ACRD3V_11260 [Vicinamibacteria bacterium]
MKIKIPISKKCGCSSSSSRKLDDGSYLYRVSDESRDCERERILLSAWDPFLDSYPVHVLHVPPVVGRARVYLEGSALMARITLDDDAARAAVEDGELWSASVGFRRLDSMTTTSGEIVTTRARLSEVSLVPAGCNFSARREKARVIPPRRIPVSAVPELVRKQARETLHVGAIAMLCSETGAIDEDGLRMRMKTSSELAAVVAHVLRDMDRRASAIADEVAGRLS